MKARLLVINGPNLNMLGVREPEIYGSASYEDLTKLIQETCYNERGIAVACYHSNHEGNIIDTIQDTLGRYDGIVINPGAYTHYSYAIHDALKGIPVPAIEVHISDTSRREEFRRISVTAPACIAQIAGKGFGGYIDAIDILLKELDL
ncbi:MAG: type II 3-dehydroquinate dehydratase [Oscillospiraceae bacterium]|nr:type II 3-dehydroquinate dehydratase [Oscillospiraceae bacterium]